MFKKEAILMLAFPILVIVIGIVEIIFYPYFSG